MPEQSVAKALTVEFAGKALTPNQANTLVEGFVDDSRTVPGMFVLRFRDPHRNLLQQAGISIGVKTRLLADSGQGARPLLTGNVTALEVEIDETGTFTLVRGLDEAHKLFRGRRVDSYQNMTVADICSRVAQRAGLKAGRVDIAGPVLEHVAQPNVTDWEFLGGLAQDAGAQVFVEDGKLNVVKPTEASGGPAASTKANAHPLVLEMGVNLLRCRAGVSAAEQVSTVEVRGWDVRTKRALVSTVPAGKTTTLELGVSATQVTSPFGEARFLVTDAACADQAQTDQLAKALAERIAGSFAELEAVIRGNPEVRAGGAVALNGVGTPFEGRYTVTSSRHVFDPRHGYETWITVSGQQERSLYSLARGGPDAGARTYGLVNATVTDTKDPEKLGRVKVRFPWLSDSYASDWARTAQSGGTSGGDAFIPEVGSEVLVGFEQGHMGRPYVLAGLYNGKDKPKPAKDADLVDGTSGVVNRRAAAFHGGDQVELLDTASGPLGIRLTTGDGKLQIHMDRKKTSIVVHSDGTVEIDAKETVTIKAGKGITMDAGQGALDMTAESVKVTARKGIDMNGGNGQVKVATGGAMDLQGNQVTVKGTGRTEIKGGSTASINAPMVRIN